MDSDNLVKDISRRTFCGFASVGMAGLLFVGGCNIRPRSLKYPENAEEIADFYEFFISPAFNEDAAIKGLKVTGEPKIENRYEDWRYATYPKQNDLVREIELCTRTEPTDLSSVIIRYERPIRVSLGRLESLCGRSLGLFHVGGLDRGPSPSTFLAFSNSNGPTQKNDPPAPEYGFSPKSKDNVYDGSILISTEQTENNEKNVDSIRFQRIKKL